MLDPRDEVHAGVADALRDPLERLADEVELVARHFRVLFRGAAAQTVRAGGPFCPPWLAAHLGDRLGLPALTPDPTGRGGVAGTGAGGAVSLPGRPGEWAVACGLAGRPDAAARRAGAVLAKAAAAVSGAAG